MYQGVESTNEILREIRDLLRQTLAQEISKESCHQFMQRLFLTQETVEKLSEAPLQSNDLFFGASDTTQKSVTENTAIAKAGNGGK